MPRTFTLLRTLGRGAHGTVHLAALRDDDDWKQTVAVKQLLPEWSRDPDLVARLKDEARLLALLHHEHVVRVHGLTRIDGNLAILMEPIDGVDLGQLAATHGALPRRVALEIVEAVADALDAAWETIPEGQAGPLRVVHRDIKPSNVMVTTRGGVKVMDFGVAHASFDAREVETRSQQYGTARYMAPERWLSGTADHRSDVFSLGITLAELCTGRAVGRPRLVPHLFDEDLASAVVGLDGPLRELVLAMTRFEPLERPTATEVVERCRAAIATMAPPGLREWSAHAVVVAEPVPLDPTLGPTVVHESPLPPTGAATTPPPPVGGRRWMTWALVALLGIGTFAAVPWLRTRATDRNPGIATAPAPVTAPPATPPPPTEIRPVAAPVVSPAPAPAPRVRKEPVEPTPAPVPAPVPGPIPEPEIRRVPVRFVLAPGLTARTEAGTLGGPPTVLQLPANRTVNVTVTEGDSTWSCTIHVANSATEVRIHPYAEGRCSQ